MAPLFLSVGRGAESKPDRLPVIETIAEAVRLPQIETVQASSPEQPAPKPRIIVQPKPAVKPTVPLHVYPGNLYGIEESTVVEQTHITAVYFVPADQVGGQLPDWQENMSTTLEAIKTYMAREFSGRLTISYTTHPTVIFGDHELGTYDSLESAGKFSMYQEVTEKISWSTIQGDQRSQGRYPVLLVYYQTGFEDRYQSPDARFSTFGWLATSFIPAFQLEDGMISGERQQGLIVSAHEFAHLLGIPHPWEMDPPVEDQPWNLMGYQAHGLLMDTRIDARVKEAMGW